MEAMFSRIWRAVALALVVSGVSPAQAQESQSAPLVKQLVTAMAGDGLDAIAARDPRAPDRFIAALVFPDSQLLVVSAPYPTPAALDAYLTQRQYRDVYTALQQASIKEGKIFIQDLGCDGLRPGTDGSVDIMYEHVTAQTIFDGNWKKQRLTESAYQARFREADATYSHMLTALLSVAQSTAPAGKRPL
jgi:hypothetical protein